MKTIKGFIAILSVALAAVFAASAQVNLTSLDGTHVNIEAQNGKVVVLAIGASWLPLSNKQAEFTNSLAKKYAGKNVVFYFVATDSSNVKSKNYATDDAIKKFAFGNKLTAAVLRDSDGAATLKIFNVEQVPSFVILDKNGKQVGEPIGGVDPTGKYDITIPISKAIDKIL
ncbi:MAG: TlpA disulfide reductase family protein [Acidobacteriota bacterium]